MEAIANDLYIQLGAVGLLAASGWVVAFVVWRDRKNERARNDKTHDEAMTLIKDCTKVFEIVADRLRQGG